MFKLIEKYEFEPRFLKCYYIGYSPAKTSTKIAPNNQIYVNLPREDFVISLLNSYLDLKFKLSKKLIFPDMQTMPYMMI